MNIFDKTIHYISPKWALEREIARQRLKRLGEFYEKDEITNRGAFEAVANSRTEYDYLNSRNDADTAITEDLENLRNFVRQNEYNNGYLAGPLRRIADHVVGTGFRFQSRVVPDKKYSRIQTTNRITKDEAEQFNFHAEKYFKIWANKYCDAQMSQTFEDMTWLAELTRNRDGEVLIIGRNSNRPDRIIPYCQQIVEIDRLETPPDLRSDPNVRNGIRYDSEGVPSIYYILKRHPGNSINNWRPGDEDYEKVPAFNPNGTRKVFHLFRRLRPEQTRGFAAIAAGLPSLLNATRYAKAEMFAALEDACMTGIVKTNAPRTFQENYSEPGQESNKRIHEFSPGKWHYLNPYEDVTIRDPSRPNDKFLEILHSFYEGPSNAISMPPELFLQSLGGLNYSNARTIIIMWLKVVRIEQQFDVNHYLSETWANVLPQFILKGYVNAANYAQRHWDYLASQWIPPKLDWVDPLNEVQGKQEEIKILAETPQSVCATKGVDFEENAETMARALAKVKELEKEYGVVMPRLFDVANIKQNKDEQAEEQDTPTTNKANGKVLKIKK